MDFLFHLMEKTAIPMETPPPYGAFHLTFLILGFLAAGLAAWRLRRLGEKGSRILLFSAGLFLLLIEIWKQLFFTFYIGRGEYQWYVFPFHMCSVPMYLLLAAPFLKEGRLRGSLLHFMMIYNLLGGTAAYLAPSEMLTPWLFLTVHSFLWHLTLVFVGLWLGFSDLTEKRMRDFGDATAALLLFTAAAFLLNLVFRRASGGDLNMFFVGPNPSPLIVFRDIARAWGWAAGTAVYLLSVLLGGFLIFLPFFFAAERKRRRTGRE